MRNVNSICSRLLLLALLALSSSSCAGFQQKGGERRDPVPASQVVDDLRRGPERLESVSMQMDEILAEFRKLSARSGGAWRARGYLDAGESDHLETLLFKYMTARDVLCELVATLGGKRSLPASATAEEARAAHLLTVDAQWVLVRHSADLVALFAGDKVAVAKLNEAQFESHLPAASFETLRLNVTATDLERRLEASQVLFEKEAQVAKQGTGASLLGSPGYERLLARAPQDQARAVAAVRRAQGLRPGLKASVENRMSHTEAAKVARELGAEGGDLAYSARSLLFKVVSRMKNPRVKVIQFSKAQHAEVESLLQPGDVILTYTAGYMSDVFIPGTFKHGITYVGTPEQRQAAGVDVSRLPALAGPEKAAVQQRLQQRETVSGQKADVIEAVAEGVIFNNLGHIMDTHVNRLAVLRPRLSEADRAAFATEVFAYQGDAYDFLFDFADASRQVCTEVIYRGLNGKQGIRFALTKRGGHPTLSADDVVDYHFKTGGRHFEFVLYAEEDLAKGGHRAKVLVGEEGEGRLREAISVKR